MPPALVTDQSPVPPPSYQRALANALHLDALTLVTHLHLLKLCAVAVQMAQRRCPPPLPAGPVGAPRTYREESLLLIALLCKPQQSKRLHEACAPLCETLFVLLVCAALWIGLTRASDLIIDSAPILAWRRADPGAALGHAPAHHPRSLLLGYRVHTLLCRGTGLPLLFLLSPANVHDAPFACLLLAWALRLFQVRPRVVRLDAGYSGLKLIAWIHTTLGTRAVLPWNPKRQKKRDGLPPTWTAEELGKRASIERFFGRTFTFFRVPRPPVSGWSAVATRVALTYAARLRDRLGGLASRASRVHPLSPTRAGICMGGQRMKKRPWIGYHSPLLCPISTSSGS